MASASANLWVLLGLGVAGVLLLTRKLKKAIKPDFGAFVDRVQILPPPPPGPPKAPPPLTGLNFAVADVFDIQGSVTGFGNKDWEKTHDAATQTSHILCILVDAGATCIGKTVIDELGYGVTGDNRHFGAPTNPQCPERIVGGCCSGSAVAVASAQVDFSLGIDAVGGVRLPASFCGIIGFRPSQGGVSTLGIIPVSQSLDAVGLFTKDPDILRRVGHVLLQLPYQDTRHPRHFIIADDCFQLSRVSSNQITEAVTKSIEKVFGRQLLNRIKLGDYLAPKVPSLKQIKCWGVNAASKPFLELLAIALQLFHKHEFSKNHGDWVRSNQNDVDPILASQVGVSVESAQDDVQHLQTARTEMRTALNALLKDDGILVIPTVAALPPKYGAKEISSEDYWIHNRSLLAISSMSGCCQITLPTVSHEKCPLSVSFIARSGADRFLMDSMQLLYAALQEQSDVISKSSPSSSTGSKEELAEIAKQKGNVAYKENQWQKAANFYSEAIKLVSSNATYFSNRAAAYLELGSYLQAEADCSTAISLDKKNVKAYLRRGTARNMLGYYQEAIDDFKHALVLEPTNKAAISALNRLNKLFP